MRNKINPTIYKTLALYGISEQEVNDIKSIPSNVNRVYLVVSGKGKFVLKNYLLNQSPEVDSIHSVVVQLLNSGLSVPQIFKNKKGDYLTKIDGQNWDLSLYIDHIDYSDQVYITDPHLKLVSRELAKIHRFSLRDEFIRKLEPVDFEKMLSETNENITHFLTEYENILKKVESGDRGRMITLKNLIQLSKDYRVQGISRFAEFLAQKSVPTHGDYSMVNVLITKDDNIYTTDWDNLALRPLVWELQASLSLFSLKETGNAYIFEPDLKKLETFLNAYLTENPMKGSEIILLPQVALFNFAVYWLSYTLPELIKGDFRLLQLVPESVNKGLYWLKHYKDYQSFIKRFCKT